jgi:hypothetical protein
VGRRCPRLKPAREPAAHAGRLWTELRHRVFRVGERLRVTISAPHHHSEPIEFVFRAGHKPRARLLK